MSSSCSNSTQDSFGVNNTINPKKLTDIYPLFDRSINGIDAAEFIRVSCSSTNHKGVCKNSELAIHENSAILDGVVLTNSVAGNKTVTVVTNLNPKPGSSPEFTYKSIVITVTTGQAIRVIYHWLSDVCSGPAPCTAALSESCSSIFVAVSATKFKMPNISLFYLDAGNNLIPVISNNVAENNQQVFLNTSLQNSSLCRVPSSFPKFSSRSSFMLSGKTLTEDKFFPFFEGSTRPNLQALSDHLNDNRLIAGSRFLITMNGDTFRSGTRSIGNVENNVLSMGILYGSTTILAVVDEDWISRVSTMNVSLGKLKFNAFDSSCNINSDETSTISLLLYFGNEISCNNSLLNPLNFSGLNHPLRFIAGEFSASSLYFLRPKSGRYFFCLCTSILCASKSFQIIPGAPVDLQLKNISLASSFDPSGAGLNCNPTSNPECGSNAYIEFEAFAFDVNINRVYDSNYSFTVLVQPVSIVETQSVILWEYPDDRAPDQKIDNNLATTSFYRLSHCTLSSSTCRVFVAGVRGVVYSIKISLSSAGANATSVQAVSERMYRLATEPVSLTNFSYQDPLKPFFSASTSFLESAGTKNLVLQRFPSLHIQSFRIHPCDPGSQVHVSDLTTTAQRNDNKFGRCQCAKGNQQNRPPNIAESGRGFGDTISCSLCPENTYQPDVGGSVGSCKSCQSAGVFNLPSSTLKAVGQTSLSACKCAPNYLFVRIAELPISPSTSRKVTEVCQGLYSTTAPKDCFCIRCNEKQQVCSGHNSFVPFSTESSTTNATSVSTNAPLSATLGSAHFSFYNNSAYYTFLKNTSAISKTASELVLFYNLSSAAMACRPRADLKFSCFTPSDYKGSQCEYGYTGFLCSSCAVYADVRFERSSGNSCTECKESEDNLSRFLFFIFILAIILVCFYFIGEARKPSAVKNKFSIGTKTFLNHLQVLSFMGDLQSSWSGLVRSMFSVSNLSNLGFQIGNVGCSVPVNFQSKLIIYCMSPFLISLVPMFIYVIESLVCYRKLVIDTRRRLRLLKNHQDYAALLNLDKGYDLDYIQNRYTLEESELLHLSLTWKDHLHDFKKMLSERKDLTPEEAVNMRYLLGKNLLKKQVWTDSVVVLMVVTFLLFSTISRQIFFSFSIRECESLPPYFHRFFIVVWRLLQLIMLQV